MFNAACHQRNTHLQSHKRSRSDPTTFSINVEAILFQTVPIPEEHLDDAQQWCKPALATSAREATVDHLVDPPRWGNSRGLSTLEKIDKLTSDVRRLEEKNTNHSTEMVDLKTKMAVIETKLDIMAPESSSYLAVRNRFFSTYCRDIIGTTTSKDRDAVPLGNKKAHGGDIITDRRLYANGTRFDDSIFEDLYGIHWARVPQIEGDPAIINALNTHASAVANKDYLREHLTPLNTAFNRLIQLMKEKQFRSFANLPMAEYNKENQALINRYRSALS